MGINMNGRCETSSVAFSALAISAVIDKVGTKWTWGVPSAGWALFIL